MTLGTSFAHSCHEVIFVRNSKLDVANHAPHAKFPWQPLKHKNIDSHRFANKPEEAQLENHPSAKTRRTTQIAYIT